MVVPLCAANHPSPLLSKQVIELVEAIEYEGSRLWVVAEEEGEGLAVQAMSGEALQNLRPLSPHACWLPSGDA